MDNLILVDELLEQRDPTRFLLATIFKTCRGIWFRSPSNAASTKQLHQTLQEP